MRRPICPRLGTTTRFVHGQRQYQLRYAGEEHLPPLDAGQSVLTPLPATPLTTHTKGRTRSYGESATTPISSRRQTRRHRCASTGTKFAQPPRQEDTDDDEADPPEQCDLADFTYFAGVSRHIAQVPRAAQWDVTEEPQPSTSAQAKAPRTPPDTRSETSSVTGRTPGRIPYT